VVAISCVGLGWLAVRSGSFEDAKRLFREGIASYGALEYRNVGGVARAALAYSAQGPGEILEARHHVGNTLQWAAQHEAYFARAESLPAAAIVRLKLGKTENAIEIYELARTLPCIANCRWHQDVVGAAIARAAAQLPERIVAAAKERGRARDLQETLVELAQSFAS
jgi:hypothetical protein